MQKKFFFVFVTALVGVSLFLAGCANDTTDPVTTTVTQGVAADLAGLQKVLDRDGVNPVYYYGTLAIDTETISVPAGKTLIVEGGGVTIETGTLAVAGG